MEPNDDIALLREYCQNQSSEAFAALVARHINLVHSVAFRQVGNPHHAEEITQAVFIILANKAASLRSEQALSSWLFQTTCLTSKNFIRSEMRRHRREQEAYMRSAMNETSDEVWNQISPLIDDAVAGLSDKDRRAIVLRFYEGRNLREVGAALGANEEAAKKRVGRALEKLRSIFAKQGVSNTAESIAQAITVNSIQTSPPLLLKATATIAFTKGAAASVSTLALSQGALKFMAWTKAKTAVVAGTGVLLVAGITLVTVVSVRSLEYERNGYSVTSRVEQSGQGITYVWTVHNHQQDWGLDQFAVEVPVNTRVLTNSLPPPFDNSDESAQWTIQETRQQQVDPHDGNAWLPAPQAGKKWILWWGQSSGSVYPPGSVATFSLTTDAATAPGSVYAYTITYTPQNDPHYYQSFRTKVTGPAF